MGGAWIRAEEDLARCAQDSECIIVAYSHCCGSTKRAINSANEAAYNAHPEWQIFDDPGTCATIGLCPDDTNVTEALCAEGLCTMVFA